MIKGINLLPEELRFVEKGHFYLLVSLSLLLYLAALYFAYDGQKSKLSAIGAKEHTLKMELSSLEKQSSLTREINQEIGEIEGAKRILQTRMELIRPLRESRVSWSDQLYELSSIVPKGVWLTRLKTISIGEGAARSAEGFVINGMAQSTRLLTEFMDELSNSPHFDRVEMKFANKAELGSYEAFHFELEIRLEGRS